MNKLPTIEIVALAMIILGNVFCVVSFATDYWAETKETTNNASTDNQTIVAEVHYGLIRAYLCSNGTNSLECRYEWLRDLTAVEMPYLNACLSVAVLAFLCDLFALIAMMYLIVKCGCRAVSSLIRKMTAVSLMVAVAFHLIAVITFAAKDEKSLRNEPGISAPGVEVEYKFGFSWGMAILAIICEILGICLVLYTRRNSDDDQEYNEY